MTSPSPRSGLRTVPPENRDRTTGQSPSDCPLLGTAEILLPNSATRRAMSWIPDVMMIMIVCWSRVSAKSRLRTCRGLADRMPPTLAAKLLTFGQALLDLPAGR